MLIQEGLIQGTLIQERLIQARPVLTWPKARRKMPVKTLSKTAMIKMAFAAIAGFPAVAALAAVAAFAAAIGISSAATAAERPPCAVPDYLLFGDSHLNRVSAAVTGRRQLTIVVIGTGS